MIRYLYRLFRKVMIGRPSKRLYKFMITDWKKLGDLEQCKKVLETKRFNRNLQPLIMEYPKAKSIVVIAPHPDDDIIGAGGTLIKAKNNGANISVIYITNGLQENSEKIKKEATTVCKTVGFASYFLNCETRSIPINNNAINKKFSSIINKIKPDVLFTSFLLDDHDDHRRVNQLISSNISTINLPGLEIWSYQIYSSIFPNVVVDITNQKEEKKNLIHIWESVSRFNDLAHYILGVNAANCRYLPSDHPIWVESFFVLPLAEYLELCNLYFSNDNSKNYYFNKYITN